jgi:hypothetical protein
LSCVETLDGSPPIAQQHLVVLSEPKIGEFAGESTFRSPDGIFDNKNSVAAATRGRG